MKITLNLAVSPSFREQHSLTWSAPTALAALAVLIVLAHSTVRDLRAYRKAEQELVKPQRQERELVEREAGLRRGLERPESRATLRKAQLVNSLIEKKQTSVSALAIEVADLLPPDARLVGLGVVRSDNGSFVKFQVNGRNAQALETFGNNVLDSSDFEDFVLGSVGFGSQGAGAGEVTVTCTARYVGTGNYDAGDDNDEPSPIQGGESKKVTPKVSEEKSGR